MPKNDKNKTPPCSDGTQAHHWIIDSQNIGRCTKCALVKDFTDSTTEKTGYNMSADLMMYQMRLPKVWHTSKRMMGY